MSRSSKEVNQDFGETTFIGSKNLKEGVLAKGVFKKRFEREANGPTGKFTSVTYFLDTEDGSVGINKLGNLGYLMEKLKVQEGEEIIVEYNGRDGNNYHSFDITVL